MLKRSVEGLLGSPALAPMWRGRTRGRDLVLGYHNVVPPGEHAVGSQSLHLSSRLFLDQVESAAQRARIVPLQELFSPAESGEARVAITFDDAYSGVVDYALPELKRLGIPATVFLPPGHVGGHDFWWDAITPPGDMEPPEAVRNHALTVLAGEKESIRQWAAAEGLPWNPMPAHARCASLAAIQDAASDGIRFGSHTWSHPNLAALDPVRLREELQQPFDWLTEQDLLGTDIIAYPYGLESPQVREMTREVGYSAGLLIEGGWCRLTEEPAYGIPRLNIPAGLSLQGFRMRLSGLLA